MQRTLHTCQANAIKRFMTQRVIITYEGEVVPKSIKIVKGTTPFCFNCSKRGHGACACPRDKKRFLKAKLSFGNARTDVRSILKILHRALTIQMIGK